MQIFHGKSCLHQRQRCISDPEMAHNCSQTSEKARKPGCDRSYMSEHMQSSRNSLRVKILKIHKWEACKTILAISEKVWPSESEATCYLYRRERKYRK